MVPVEGSQAQGYAGVFGGSVNPLQYYIQQKRQNRLDAASEVKAQRDRRDKLMDYNDKFNPSSKFTEFNYRINDMAQNDVRDWTREQLNSMRDSNEIKNELQYRQGVVNAFKDETEGWKNKIDDLEKTVETKSNLYNPKVKSSIRDIYLSPDGKLKDNGTVREGMHNADNILLNPDNFNKTGVMLDWVDNLKDQGRAMYSTKWNDGYTPDQVENIVTSKLQYQRNPDGSLKVDSKTGSPILKMTDDTYNLAMANPMVKALVEKEAGDSKPDQMRWLQQNVPGGADSIKENRNITSGHKIDKSSEWKSMFGINFSGDNDPKQVYDRFHANDKFIRDRNQAYIQHVIAPFEGSSAYYTDSSGNRVKDESKAKNLEFEFTDKDKVPISAIMKELIFFDDEKYPTTKDKLDAVNVMEGKKGKISFDLTTKDGQVEAHLFTNRLQDKFSTKGNAYGDDYRKVVEKELGYNEKSGASGVTWKSK